MSAAGKPSRGHGTAPATGRARWGPAVAALRGAVAELSRPGESDLSPRRLRTLTTAGLSAVLIGTNLIGSVIVLALLALRLIPLPTLAHLGRVRLDNGVLAAAYVLVALPAGWTLGHRTVWSAADWLLAERPPTPAQTRALLSAPRRLFGIQILLWLIAAALFSLFNAHFSGRLEVRVAIVVSLTGFVTAACAYLATERLLRSLTARALAHGIPDGLHTPGSVTRTLLAWGLGSVVPVGGLTSIGILALSNDGTTNRVSLGVSIIVLSGTGIVVGLIAVLLAARTTAEPISSVSRALARVRRGDFSARVPVYDASEIGQLQVGFNTMAAGLAERERIRALFGTYVDPDVAARILSAGTRLSGETVEVTCLFLDIRGFTGFAERTAAETVVATLNALFDLAVPIIHRHGGRIDTFIGDGLLAVFGAPRRLPDHADRGLLAAREIAAAVAEDGRLGLSVGLGLNSGPVVAGNVGGGGRYEFSVIGDTVNVAARVEAATRQTGDTLLVSEHTRAHLRVPAELVQRPGVVLKGKDDPVRVFGLGPAPASHTPAP
ncbi:adenylate/guanylate cyclase domain-containing protein [Conexibacter sp. DBS9H8]|uniref:adenylate/guanylate cyclase domain-containing protein n=1 Tax=Conexibacter sp. DBS9H8 TaxID=2937801 RepID=UPI002010C3DA|nr:adenylate/guanylate cyclase domain-containing protein [Conexibacter sp. DBS9H8]